LIVERLNADYSTVKRRVTNWIGKFVGEGLAVDFPEDVGFPDRKTGGRDRRLLELSTRRKTGGRALDSQRRRDPFIAEISAGQDEAPPVSSDAPVVRVEGTS
jgi:hypothetical protein